MDRIISQVMPESKNNVNKEPLTSNDFLNNAVRLSNSPVDLSTASDSAGSWERNVN